MLHARPRASVTFLFAAPGGTDTLHAGSHGRYVLLCGLVGGFHSALHDSAISFFHICYMLLCGWRAGCTVLCMFNAISFFHMHGCRHRVFLIVLCMLVPPPFLLQSVWRAALH
jgi:hypothetical protein